MIGRLIGATALAAGAVDGFGSSSMEAVLAYWQSLSSQASEKASCLPLAAAGCHFDSPRCHWCATKLLS